MSPLIILSSSMIRNFTSLNKTLNSSIVSVDKEVGSVEKSNWNSPWIVQPSTMEAAMPVGQATSTLGRSTFDPLTFNSLLIKPTIVLIKKLMPLPPEPITIFLICFGLFSKFLDS